MAKELTASLENYLEVIYRIIRQRGVARVKEIAKTLSVRMPSVNSALKALQERELVEHSRYGYVELTEKGEEEAKKVLRRHETLCEFLQLVFNIDPELAEEDACKIEHVLSRTTFERFLALVEYLQTCSDSEKEWFKRFHEYYEKGPSGKTQIADKKLTSLAEINPGHSAIVHRLLGAGHVHQRMLDMGVVPGTPVTVERVAPLGDPIEIKVRGYHLSLRREEAAKIKVIPLQKETNNSKENKNIAAERGR